MEWERRRRRRKVAEKYNGNLIAGCSIISEC
jgi:hypothetical protein